MMDVEYEFDLMLEKLWGHGLIEDTKDKAQKVSYFNIIKKEFKEWLIEIKGCSENNFYNEITEDNYLQFRKWQIAKTKTDIKKLEIAIELFGENTINSINVIADPDKLKAILMKHNLKSTEAINLIKVNGKKAFNPTFYNKCADTIINELKEIELGESKQDADDRLKRIESMIEKQTINKSADDGKEEDITNKPWFIVGMLFASGEIYRIHRENKKEFRKTAKALGDLNYRQIISNTLNHDVSQYGKKNSRNIYLSMEKMTAIINHCKENGITINDRFMANYNTLQSKS
jgi:hypothetical protein